MIVDHLHFRQASAMTSPGLESFVFSCCKELIAALGNFEFLGCLKNAL